MKRRQLTQADGLLILCAVALAWAVFELSKLVGR